MQSIAIMILSHPSCYASS